MNSAKSFFNLKFKGIFQKKCLYFVASLLYFSNNFFSFGQTLTVDTYNASTTWVVPPCVTSITVRAWGGGGAGGGASSTDRNGGGGGGGAYCTKVETVTPGETLIITVGTGGLGVASGTGGAGGLSQVSHSVGPVVFCRAAGGAGGQKGANSTTAGAGGAGGAIANNIPAGTGFRGGNGGASDPNTATDQSGGGGGGAGSGSNGGDGAIITAGIAGSPGGGAGGMGIGTTGSTGGLGSPGSALGGGGGGSTVFSSGTRAGAAGAQGQVTITYVATGCEPAASMFAYSAPGTYSWVVPICVNFVTVEAWGGGGGGGGNIAVLATSGGETCTGAGGGGGGAYAARTYAVTPGQTYTIVVGNGGAAGAAGVGTTASITTPAGAGGTGQSSTFSGPATVGPGTLTAVGGAGGAGAGGRNTSSSACLFISGAAGAGATGLNGTVNFTGGNGAAGLILDHSTDKSGGGGGAAGPGGNGGAAPSAGSVGVAVPPAGIGNPPGGNGGTGRMWNVPALSQQNGVAGAAFGGGGGGSLIHTSALGAYTATGGAGGRGEVRLTYNTTCPLPIELVSFEGECSGVDKVFSWVTASEMNNQYFTIEQSADGQNYNNAAIVPGAGTTSETQYYSTRLTDANNDYNYYRLKQTDIDGSSDISQIIYVDCDRELSKDEVYLFPNPASEHITLTFGSDFAGNFEMTINDILGKKVKSEKFEFSKNASLAISVEDLEKGNYFINFVDIETGETVETVPFTKID